MRTNHYLPTKLFYRIKNWRIEIKIFTFYTRILECHDNNIILISCCDKGLNTNRRKKTTL